MRRALLWIGLLVCGGGIALAAAGAVLGYMGMDASYNLGDPTKLEFILVPFWQIGLAIAVIGGILALASRPPGFPLTSRARTRR
jgi:hypothetical protein